MAVAVELPKLGLQASALLVAEWYLPDGATVHRGEAVCRVETNDVAFEVEADREGVLRHRIEAGFRRPAGAVLGMILASGERMPDFEPVENTPPPEIHHPHNRQLPSDEEWEQSVRAMRYWAGQAEQRGHEHVEEATMEEPRRVEIVPFPKRPVITPPSWEAVPGSAADFDTPLFGHSRHSSAFAADPEADAALDAELAIGLELEPAAITAPAPEPALPPAWEPEPEAEPALEPAGALQPDLVPYAEPLPVAAGLSMRSSVDLTEAHKLRAQLGREWGSAPGNEAVVLRAVGRALAEFGAEPDVSLLRFESGEVRNGLLRNASLASFREPVADAGEDDRGACVVSLFPEIDEAEPKLEPGDLFALAIGAERTVVRWEGERVSPAPALTLTLRCEPTRVEPFEAARFLARVRELIEAPYALLVA